MCFSGYIFTAGKIRAEGIIRKCLYEDLLKYIASPMQLKDTILNHNDTGLSLLLR